MRLPGDPPRLWAGSSLRKHAITGFRELLLRLLAVGGQDVDGGERPATANDGDGAGDPRPAGEAGHRERGSDRLALVVDFEPETVHGHILSQRQWVVLWCYRNGYGANCQEWRVRSGVLRLCAYSPLGQAAVLAPSSFRIPASAYYDWESNTFNLSGFPGRLLPPPFAYFFWW